MKRMLKWYELLALNGYQLGLSMASNVISPLLLPALVLAFMPPEKKNTYTALVYVTGLAVAMFIQPVMGMLSDRSTAKWDAAGLLSRSVHCSIFSSLALLAHRCGSNNHR